MTNHYHSNLHLLIVTALSLVSTQILDLVNLLLFDSYAQSHPYGSLPHGAIYLQSLSNSYYAHESHHNLLLSGLFDHLSSESLHKAIES